MTLEKLKRIASEVTASCVLLLFILISVMVYQMITINAKKAKISELEKQIDLLYTQRQNEGSLLLEIQHLKKVNKSFSSFLIPYRIDEKNKKQPNITRNGVGINSIYQFMEFDSISNNMIIRKNRTHYTMVIQCNGVNYDLMSEAEKISVEEGFVQFLNILRFPIQLYVQTRSLNLRDIIEEYKKRVDAIAADIDKYICSDYLHLSEEGIEVAAKQVAECIRENA